jgi:hypothetical protein
MSYRNKKMTSDVALLALMMAVMQKLTMDIRFLGEFGGNFIG